jgi:hypothetical protein
MVDRFFLIKSQPQELSSISRILRKEVNSRDNSNLGEEVVIETNSKADEIKATKKGVL